MAHKGKNNILPEGRITEEALKEWEKRVGSKLRIPWRFNELVSYEAIRNYVNGLGDDNPLWTDREYALKTKYGTIVAPPSWLYSVCLTYVLQGLPGVHAYHSGNDWRFYKPIIYMDRLRPEIYFTGFEKKKSEFAGNMVIEYQETKYFNQRDELVAKANAWLARVERASTRKKGKYASIKLPHPWSEEEVKNIEDDILAEKIRGSDVRYWEDVNIGDGVGPLIKGPLGLGDEFAYFAGAGVAALKAHRIALKEFRRHPAWAFRDFSSWRLEPIASVHWNFKAAEAAGLPYPYDAGIQRQSWLIQLFTDWMGDEGWLKSNYAEYRKFFYWSDVLWIEGRVTNKYMDENDEYCVDIETSAVNQRGEDTMPGRGTVILPSRKAETWPVAIRLPRH